MHDQPLSFIYCYLCDYSIVGHRGQRAWPALIVAPRTACVPFMSHVIIIKPMLINLMDPTLPWLRLASSMHKLTVRLATSKRQSTSLTLPASLPRSIIKDVACLQLTVCAQSACAMGNSVCCVVLRSAIVLGLLLNLSMVVVSWGGILMIREVVWHATPLG